VLVVLVVLADILVLVELVETVTALSTILLVKGVVMMEVVVALEGLGVLEQGLLVEQLEVSEYSVRVIMALEEMVDIQTYRQRTAAAVVQEEQTAHMDQVVMGAGEWVALLMEVLPDTVLVVLLELFGVMVELFHQPIQKIYYHNKKGTQGPLF
jgi:hypothetical protein